MSFPVCAKCGAELGPDFTGCDHVTAPPKPTPKEIRAMQPRSADLDRMLVIPGVQSPTIPAMTPVSTSVGHEGWTSKGM